MSAAHRRPFTTGPSSTLVTLTLLVFVLILVGRPYARSEDAIALDLKCRAAVLEPSNRNTATRDSAAVTGRS